MFPNWAFLMCRQEKTANGSSLATAWMEASGSVTDRKKMKIATLNRTKMMLYASANAYEYDDLRYSVCSSVILSKNILFCLSILFFVFSSALISRNSKHPKKAANEDIYLENLRQRRFCDDTIVASALVGATDDSGRELAAQLLARARGRNPKRSVSDRLFENLPAPRPNATRGSEPGMDCLDE